MRFARFAGLTAMIPVAVPAAPLHLQPSSQWILDYADTNCRLIRNFGTGKHAVKLVFEQVAPDSPITVMMIGNFRTSDKGNSVAFEPLPGVSLARGQSLVTADNSKRVAYWPRRLGRGQWGLVPDNVLRQMRQADPMAADLSNSVPSNAEEKPSAIKWSDHRWTAEPRERMAAANAGFSARAAQVTSVVVNQSVALDTGPLDKPFEALEKCATESLPDWGIDPAVQSTVAVSAHPVKDPRFAFTGDDYPKAALAAFKESVLEVWLNIDATGSITACRSISDFASPEINDAICGMIKRKERFVPARTSDGRAVPDYYIQSFVFRLEGGPTP